MIFVQISIPMIHLCENWNFGMDLKLKSSEQLTFRKTNFLNTNKLKPPNDDSPKLSRIFNYIYSIWLEE